jgi:hypothetical protein
MIKGFNFILILFASLFILFSSTANAFPIFGNACSGDAAQNSPTCQQVESEGGANNRVTGTNNIINAAVNILAIATGVAAVIVIIIGGFTMVTSAGNQEAIVASRRRIIAAVIGLAIVALSWTIIRFITDKLIK